MASTDPLTSNAPEPSTTAVPEPGGMIRRFSAGERLVHRTTAVLMSVCLVTAAILYNGSISIYVGHRYLVELIHVYCGFALPVPMTLGLVSLAYRADLAGSADSLRRIAAGCARTRVETGRSGSASSTPGRN